MLNSNMGNTLANFDLNNSEFLGSDLNSNFGESTFTSSSNTLGSGTFGANQNFPNGSFNTLMNQPAFNNQDQTLFGAGFQGTGVL